MAETTLTKEYIIETAKKGWDIIVTIYKDSQPEERKMILKILGGIIGFGTLLEYLKKL